VLVVQDDRFSGTDSVTVCLLTTDPTDLPLLRVSVPADQVTGLREASRVMVDTVTTTRRDNLRDQVGRLSATDMVRVERALLVFLGLAG
jgi:mRNA interferase MazF